MKCCWIVGVIISLSAVAHATATDLEGHTHALEGRVSAIVFLNPECPICRSEVAAINAVAGSTGETGRVLGVISDPGVTRASAVAFAKDYGAKFAVLFDGSGDLAAKFK